MSLLLLFNGGSAPAAYTLTLTDSVSLSDSLSKSISRAISESLSLSESLVRSTARRLAETFSLSESYAAVRAKVLTFTDSIGLTDALSRYTAKGITDVITLGDVLQRKTAKSFLEVLPLLETLSRFLDRTFTDAVSLAELFGTTLISANNAIRLFFAEIWQRAFPVATPLRLLSVFAVTRAWKADELMIHSDPKDSEAIENFRLDWSDALGDDSITSSTWEVPAGLTNVASTNTTTYTTIRLGGGLPGHKYTVRNLVTLNSGQVKVQAILLPVV